MLQSPPQTLVMDSTPAAKRNPFDLFASIFRRKTQETDISEDNSENSEETSNQTTCVENFIPRQPRSSPVPITGGSQCERSRSSSPASVKFRRVDSDMAALRLSRQDNPYLQQKLERMSYQEEIGSYQSSCSTSPQKIRCDMDIADEECLSLHQHLIRSPPPQFPQNISQFVFLSKSDSPQHFQHEPEWNMVKSMSVSPTQFDSVDNIQSQRIRDLNPIMTKTGIDALDPRVREVLEFQRQRYYTDRENFDYQSNLSARRSSDISPVPHKLLSVPSKTKWLSKAGFRPFSFPAVPVVVTGSLPGLSGVNGDSEPKCLAPVKSGRQMTGGSALVASSSVQDLYVSNKRKQSVFPAYGMTHTSSLEPLISSRSKSSLDSG